LFFFEEIKAQIVLSRHPSSFRDPSGFIFTREGVLYRQINNSYKDNYLLLKNSGLLQKLINRKLLISHDEMNGFPEEAAGGFLMLQPDRLTNISYATEWSFSALKDAALLHLEIMATAMEHGMILKDATPYNVQFRNGQPIFIDTLSFITYNENMPWVAYRQFCENFVYPLLLERNKVLYCHQVAAAFPEGIPAQVVANLLPFRCRFNLGCWLHVYLPASFSNAATGARKPETTFNKQKMLNLVNHLRSIISRFSSNDKSPTAWHNYYAETILSQDYLAQKHNIFQTFLAGLHVTSALDIGSNDGYFSRLMAARDIAVTAIDTDAPSVNRLYLESKSQSLSISPLIIDIAHPTPATGFNNSERDSFIKRMNAQLVVALAVIHHLVISKNIPMELIAAFFSDLCKVLIIEFVPKDDPKVKQMLLAREDIFSAYNVDEFERAFSRFFTLLQKTPVGSTARMMYLFEKK
jgi:hypothetical protein